MSKKRISIKVPPGQTKKLEDAILLVENHLSILAEDWPKLTPEQQRLVIDHSPALARIVALAQVFSIEERR